MVTVLSADEETTNDEGYPVRVGERLRAMRKQKGLSLQAVESDSEQEFKASVLGAYERGERAISVPRLQRLAKFYSVPVDQLLPKDSSPEFGWASTDDTIDLTGDSPIVVSSTAAPPNDERVTIDLAALEALAGPERDLIGRYLGTIQVQRQDFNGRVLTIRAEDLRALGVLFETTAEVIRRRLDDLGLRTNV
jgi:transcriptional regulator with XRE-family HTH domain